MVFNSDKKSFNGKISVVFLWHMHQPDYRDISSGEYYFPWTYLHAIKDYIDMAAHLENEPSARAVVNFAPILLEQLDDYSQQIQKYLAKGTRIKDAVLFSLVDTRLPECGSPEYIQLAKYFLRANRERMVQRFPIYCELADIAMTLSANSTPAIYLNEQYLIDLCFWYHLSWLSETLRRKNIQVQAWQEKGRCFSAQDRFDLLQLIGEEMQSIIPRYKALSDAGKIELCMSPYAHPIVPLLLDIQTAKQAWPDVQLPITPAYAGGHERAQWHLREGIKTFKKYFNHTPKGCWPSEGSLSDATVKLLQEEGFLWAATGDSVLSNSLKSSENQSLAEKINHEKISVHRPFQVNDQDKINIIFRDDQLSDLIGFKYSTWHSDDAVGDFINHLANIAQAADSPEDTVISIIMDGENAWEYYPENAYYFLSQLYKRINEHPVLQLTTYDEFLHSTPKPLALNHLVAGSWVYGTFSTWIGDKDKNRGWDMLCAAKQAVDAAFEKHKFSKKEREKIEKQLGLCEGSDWFWWFGDYNPAQSVADFEFLFRQHLKNLYALIKTPEPDYLNHVISVGGGDPAAGGVMRQGHDN